MKKIAIFIRTLTVAPICALLINISFYIFNPETFNNIYELIIISCILGVIPVLAYPLQRRFKIIKGNQRDSERKLAFIFSIASYIIGALFATLTHIPPLQKIIYITYFFSGVFMIIFNFILNIKASGHMCGFVGPMALVMYILGGIGYFTVIILVLIIWSSLYLKRHKPSELIIGSIIPIISMFLSILIII